MLDILLAGWLVTCETDLTVRHCGDATPIAWDHLPRHGNHDDGGNNDAPQRSEPTPRPDPSPEPDPAPDCE